MEINNGISVLIYRRSWLRISEYFPFEEVRVLTVDRKTAECSEKHSAYKMVSLNAFFTVENRKKGIRIKLMLQDDIWLRFETLAYLSKLTATLYFLSGSGGYAPVAPGPVTIPLKWKPEKQENVTLTTMNNNNNCINNLINMCSAHEMNSL